MKIPVRKFLDCKKCDNPIGVIHWIENTKKESTWESPNPDVECLKCYYKND
jgi:hypothetical protein